MTFLPMTFLLDTNAFSALMRDHPQVDARYTAGVACGERRAMLALFRNPLLRLLGRLWWLPALSSLAAWGLGGERGWQMAKLGLSAYLAFVAGLIVAALAHGVYAARREASRHRSAQHRFLCPACLHFDGFHFACGGCGKPVESFVVQTNGSYVNDCPHCHAALLSRDGVEGKGARAYCTQCQGNCDRAIHHERRVRVLATLFPDDFTSIGQVINAQPAQARNISYFCADDGAQLTYVLNLSGLAEVPQRPHALWQAERIWLDAADDDQERLALEVAEVTDRLNRPLDVTKPLTVCVPQTTLSDAVRNVLATRFKAVKYGVTPEDFLCGEQTGGGDAPPLPSALPPPTAQQVARAMKEKDETPV